MNDPELPDDLAALAQELGRGAAEPDPALGERVQARVRAELRHPEREPFWPFAAAVAAGVALLLNVGFSAANGSVRLPRQRPTDPAAICEQVRAMGLGISDEELRRQCLLMAAGETLVLYGQPYGPAGAAGADLER